MTIEELNELDDSQTYDALAKCCGTTNWIVGMMNLRPFDNEEDLLQKADIAWAGCTDKDGLEAFSHHPKIGDKASLTRKFADTREWAGDEQKGVDTATEEVINRLADGNKTYEDKFGFIFIVFATGKSAQEMLALLESRLPNDREEEIKIAMKEQHKITRLRLQKLLS